MNKVIKSLKNRLSDPEFWLLGFFIPFIFCAYAAVIMAALHAWNPHFMSLTDCLLGGSSCL